MLCMGDWRVAFTDRSLLDVWRKGQGGILQLLPCYPTPPAVSRWHLLASGGTVLRSPRCQILRKHSRPIEIDSNCCHGSTSVGSRVAGPTWSIELSWTTFYCPRQSVVSQAQCKETTKLH